MASTTTADHASDSYFVFGMCAGGNCARQQAVLQALLQVVLHVDGVHDRLRTPLQFKGYGAKGLKAPPHPG